MALYAMSPKMGGWALAGLCARPTVQSLPGLGDQGMFPHCLKHRDECLHLRRHTPHDFFLSAVAH